mgnify:CR=1 FL=1
MIRRPPRSTLDRSSAASDVYKRQDPAFARRGDRRREVEAVDRHRRAEEAVFLGAEVGRLAARLVPVSYTHLRAHETVLDLVCRLLLEKKTAKKSVGKNQRPE